MPEENQPAPAAPTSGLSASGGKKKNTATVIIIVVVAIVVLGVAGYFIRRWIVQRIADRAASGILSAVTGSNVNVDTSGNSATISNGSGSMTTGNSAEWPSSMPSSVPKYTEGKITLSSTSNATSSSTSGWLVQISNTSASEFAAYKNKLVAAGWTNSASMASEIEIDTYDNSNYEMNLTFDSSSNAVSISVAPKS